MENFEERLFDLLSAKEFEKLTKEEKMFILLHLTPAEYDAQYKVFAISPKLEYGTTLVEPLKLERKKSFFNKSIPLYQVIASAAAMLIGFYFIWPTTKWNEVTIVKTVPTIKTVYLHDTTQVIQKIIEYKTKFIASKPEVIVKQNNLECYSNLERDLVATATQIPTFRAQDFETIGQSMAEELRK